jgi:5-methylcytosine-specific restriction protein A
MAKAVGEKNPNWTRDELILALDLYRRHNGNPPGKTSKEVTELSDLLNRMGSQLSARKSNFRNPNGVYMKAMNFRRFDPVYTSQGKKGLERGGRLEAEVWSDFISRPQLLVETAAAIRLNVLKGALVEPFSEDEEEFEAEEGRVLTRVHLSRERNRKLVEQKKTAALKKDGKISCEVCSFDFEANYGARGRGFIEAHHIKAVHTLKPGDKTRLEDLALLCSNCHRMVHAKRPWLDLERLRNLLRPEHERWTE